MNTHESRPPLTAIFLLSAVALAYEVLLVRLFSVIQWHHFAFMVISLALLGYGASGSLLTVMRGRLMAHYHAAFLLNAALFGVTAIACFIAAQRMPFNALEILWDTNQWQRLLVSYLLLALPFFFVANAIALTMARFRDRIPQVYGVDLLGAGAGAILIMLLLEFLSPASVLRVIGISGVAAALFALRYFGTGRRSAAAVSLMLTAAAILVAPSSWLEPRLSQFKGLEQTLQVSGTRLLESRNDPIAQVDVVESNAIPFRYAPGMSLMSPSGPPPQLAVFRDGDEMTAIDRVTGPESQVYRDYLSSALAYHVHSAPRRALVLGAQTGGELLQAAMYDVESIDAVEADAQMTDLISKTYADYFGWSEIADRVTLFNISPRGYSASTHAKYDLVVLGVPGASSGGAAGVHALSTSYIYTIEALLAYFNLLEPDGLLSISLWTSTPPRANLRLFAIAVEALRAAGVTSPGDNMAWIRSWNTATLIIKNGVLTADEMQQVRNFSNTRAFDIAWLPDVKKDEVNRYQLLDQPVFYLAANSLLSADAADFIQRYKYDIGPVTDNRPYFNNSFRWSSLPELLSMSGRGGFALIGVGYPTLVLTLMQALVAAADTDTAAAGIRRRRGGRRRGQTRACRDLFYGDRAGVHVHRTRVYPAVHADPEPAVVCSRGRAVRFSGFFRPWQPVRAAPDDEYRGGCDIARAAPRGVVDRYHYAAVYFPAAANQRRHHGDVRTAADYRGLPARRTAGVCDGDAVSAGAGRNRAG